MVSKEKGGILLNYPIWWDTSEQNYFPYSQQQQAPLYGGIASLYSPQINRPLSPLAERGREGYSRGTQFSPQFLPPSGSLPQWLTNPNLPPGQTYGSQAGLKMADNAKWIGRGVGAATGLPGMPMLAQFLANRYRNNNVFASPTNTQGDVADSIDTMLYGDVPQQSRMLGDQGVQQGGSNFTASRMIPGSGSRMNPSSAFIYGRGFGQKMEDQRMNSAFRIKPNG